MRTVSMETVISCVVLFSKAANSNQAWPACHIILKKLVRVLQGNIDPWLFLYGPRCAEFGPYCNDLGPIFPSTALAPG